MFFYSPVLIQIYLITSYVGSLTSGSDHSTKMWVMRHVPDHSSNKKFWQKILAAWRYELAMVYL
jgi:hypothetical protein